MSTSLEDILNGSGAAKSNPEPQAEQPLPPDMETETPAQEVASTEPGEVEHVAPAVPPTAPVVEESLDKKISAFQRKAEDETRKRQDYEKQLQETKRLLDEQTARLQQIAAQQQQQPRPDIDLYDPEVLESYVNNIVEQRATSHRIVTSQELMHSKHADYAEHEQIFAQEMAAAEALGDFSLRQRMEADLLPAKFAYDYAKRKKALEEIGPDPTSYKERVIQEYLASQGAVTPQQAAPTVPTYASPAPQPPKTLAGMPSAARNVARQPWKGPTPLEKLLS